MSVWNPALPAVLHPLAASQAMDLDAMMPPSQRHLPYFRRGSSCFYLWSSTVVLITTSYCSPWISCDSLSMIDHQLWQSITYHNQSVDVDQSMVVAAYTFPGPSRSPVRRRIITNLNGWRMVFLTTSSAAAESTGHSPNAEESTINNWMVEWLMKPLSGYEIWMLSVGDTCWKASVDQCRIWSSPLYLVLGHWLSPGCRLYGYGDAWLNHLTYGCGS